MFAARLTDLSHEDYLRGEAQSPIRHEYLAGQVFAMTGGTAAHNRIAGNLFFHLRAATRGTPCAVFISDMKVYVEAQDAFYYPDVLLTCEPIEETALFQKAPCLIAEVLSPSTEVIDRREKFVAYRSLHSLRYYLLISSERRQVELYARTPEGSWTYQMFDQKGRLAFECAGLALALSLDELYEDVAFSQPYGVP